MSVLFKIWSKNEKKRKKKKREEKKLIQSYEMSRKKSSFPRYNVCKYVNVTSERDLKKKLELVRYNTYV